jgi:hypothetical protein
LKETPPRKAVHGDEPGSARTDQKRERTNPGHKAKRAAERPGQDIGNEMGPGISTWAERNRRDGDNRRERDQRENKGCCRPAEVASFGKPSESLADWRSQRVAASSVSAVQ